jgi:hypothetical protein
MLESFEGNGNKNENYEHTTSPIYLILNSTPWDLGKHGLYFLATRRLS